MKNKNDSTDLEISLRCPGCCNYLQGKHRANLLKCGHNICTECLNVNIQRGKSTYSCLICLGEYAEEDLTINFLFDELVSKYLTLNQSEKNSKEGSNALNYSLYCVQCDTILSNSLIHSKLFTIHNIISLNELIQDKNEYYKSILEDFSENFMKGNKNKQNEISVNVDGKSQIKSKIEEFLTDQLSVLNKRVKEITSSDKNSNLEALKLLGLISQDDYENLISFKNLLKSTSSDKENISSDSSLDDPEILKKFIEDKLIKFENEKIDQGGNNNQNRYSCLVNKNELEILCKNIIDVDSIYKNKFDHITNQLKEISNNINSQGYENQLDKFAKDLGEEMANYLKNFLNFNSNSNSSSITLDQQYFISQDLTQLTHFEKKDEKNLIYLYDSLSEIFLILDLDDVQELDLNSNNVSLCSDGLDTIYLVNEEEFFMIKFSEYFSVNTSKNIEEIYKREDLSIAGKDTNSSHISPVKAKIKFIEKLKSANFAQSKKISTGSKLNPSGCSSSTVNLIYYDFKIFLIGGIHNSDACSYNTVQYFDLIANIWIYLPELPQPLEHPRAIIVSNRIYIFNYIKSCYFFDLDTDAEMRRKKNSWKKIKLLYDDSYNLQLRNYSIIVERFADISQNKEKHLKEFEFIIIGGVYYQDSNEMDSKSFNRNVFRFSSKTGLIELFQSKRNILLPENDFNFAFKNSFAVMDVYSNYVLLGENKKGEVKLIKRCVNY